MRAPNPANPDLKAAEHLRATLHKGRALSEQRAQRVGYQTRRASTPEQAGPDDYTGSELAPYTGRPGALDAFSKPSLIGGQRRAHRVASQYTEGDVPKASTPARQHHAGGNS